MRTKRAFNELELPTAAALLPHWLPHCHLCRRSPRGGAAGRPCSLPSLQSLRSDPWRRLQAMARMTSNCNRGKRGEGSQPTLAVKMPRGCQQLQRKTLMRLPPKCQPGAQQVDEQQPWRPCAKKLPSMPGTKPKQLQHQQLPVHEIDLQALLRRLMECDDEEDASGTSSSKDGNLPVRRGFSGVARLQPQQAGRSPPRSPTCKSQIPHYQWSHDLVAVLAQSALK